MSEDRTTFVQACLAGDAFLDEVDDWVAEWHESDDPALSECSLDQHLGFTEQEGNLWAERPESLRFIIAAHKRHVPVERVLQGRDKWALAARSQNADEAQEVIQWLQQTGRL